MEKEEEGRSNNSVKRFKWSSIHTSQNTFQDNTDWISRLPDCLILHILSQLETKEVIKTSLLSKRWRYLWMSLPRLDFRLSKCGRKFEKTTFIDRFLFHQKESKVDEVHIQINYKEKHTLLVDSWIHFAIRRKVEELELDLVDGEEYRFSGLTLYKLPHSLFRCGSLSSLELCGCDLNLPTKIQLNSLKTLYLKYINLDPNAIEHITSSCPVLEDLHLIGCNNLMDLNICITNDNVKNLMITEDLNNEFGDNITTINAPNLISLQSYGRLPRKDYHFQELRSLMNVSFDGHSDMSDVFYGEEMAYDFTLLLHHLRHVKDFTFSSWCIQGLAAKEVWGFYPMTINATCIKIKSGLTKWELPGIAYLLKSASYLERLEISCDFYLPKYEHFDMVVEDYDFEEKDFWKLQELDPFPILKNTKTIEIVNFHSSSLVKVHKNWETLLEFVRFLLKTSKVLENMTIKTYGCSTNKMELMHEVTQKLTSFPKASPNADLFFI